MNALILSLLLSADPATPPAKRPGSPQAEAVALAPVPSGLGCSAIERRRRAMETRQRHGIPFLMANSQVKSVSFHESPFTKQRLFRLYDRDGSQLIPKHPGARIESTGELIDEVHARSGWKFEGFRSDGGEVWTFDPKRAKE